MHPWKLTDSAAKVANATNALARVRRTLLEMDRAGALVQADVQIYEMARSNLLQACRYLTSHGYKGQLQVPRSFPLDVYTRTPDEKPGENVLYQTAAYGGQLKELQDRSPVQDELARSFHGLDNEIRLVAYYTARRAQAAGVPLAAPQTETTPKPRPGTAQASTLGTLKDILESPQAMGTLGMGIMGVMGMFAMAMAKTGSKRPPILVQHGLSYEDFIEEPEAHESDEPDDAVDAVTASEACAPAAKPDPESAPPIAAPEAMGAAVTVEAPTASPAVAAVRQVQQQSLGNLADILEKGA